MKFAKTALIAAAALSFSAPVFADDDEWHYQQNQSQYITYEKAAKIATDAVGRGARTKEVDFEHNRVGGAYFEVEVFGHDGEYDVVVDAKTGRVLSKRRDY